VPPGIFGFEPGYQNPYREYNVARAKRLLAEAGYPGGIDKKTGKRLTLTYDIAESGAAGRQEAGLITKQMEAVGIKLETRSWRDVVWEERVHEGKFQFIDYGWFADYPDPENFVFLLYSKNKGVNYANYQNKEYDRLFEKMRAMPDGPSARRSSVK
jgi:ABC-type transport system substrate-binding protein